MSGTFGRWILGCVTFASPAIVAVIGRWLDDSVLRNDATCRSLIPLAVEPGWAVFPW